ncbi:nucleoside deaminase [Myroides ceti]|uniref:tRNA-specific adenosine deaminase n=1 Tax=Paenimyroides ceti TaxID=395087 RepID=A0ABT8D0B5_9FLAO|nr:nucleoside deaminase [Paenimyroides ceti]MDN3706487.1 nucleoside deaminase [Paenimyroides ceti]MDN3709784.1 nucleoside deaminase [Paenimyroides ceti]MDN3709796.1 nucleoside deaminase [Paenimyroides ceti]
MYEIFSDEYFMQIALNEARNAFDRDEIPIGAVVVANNRILAKSYNLTEALIDVTAHAEMQAISAASDAIGGKYLKNCTMYITVEPCQMCAGALYWSQISRIVYGASDNKRGFTQMGGKIHPKTEIVSGVLEKECSDLMKLFFENKR